MLAILDGGWQCQITFWKGTTQRPFSPYLGFGLTGSEIMQIIKLCEVNDEQRGPAELKSKLTDCTLTIILNGLINV